VGIKETILWGGWGEEGKEKAWLIRTKKRADVKREHNIALYQGRELSFPPLQ